MKAPVALPFEEPQHSGSFERSVRWSRFMTRFLIAEVALTILCLGARPLSVSVEVFLASLTVVLFAAVVGLCLAFAGAALIRFVATKSAPVRWSVGFAVLFAYAVPLAYAAYFLVVPLVLQARECARDNLPPDATYARVLGDDPRSLDLDDVTGAQSLPELLHALEVDRDAIEHLVENEYRVPHSPRVPLPVYFVVEDGRFRDPAIMLPASVVEQLDQWWNDPGQTTEFDQVLWHGAYLEADYMCPGRRRGSFSQYYAPEVDPRAPI